MVGFTFRGRNGLRICEEHMNELVNTFLKIINGWMKKIKGEIGA